jgi:hypothetical protein
MRSRWVLCLAAVLAFALTGESWAGPPKVDLTEYLDSHPVAGDFRYFNRSDGGFRLVEIMSATELKKSTLVFDALTEDGATNYEYDEIVHGKEARAGSTFVGDLSLIVSRPKRILPFRLTPGKPTRFKLGMSVVFQGARVGKATFSGATTFLGIESLDSAFGTFDAAHLRYARTLTIKVNSSVLMVLSSQDAWVTRELGTLVYTFVADTYQDGVFLERSGPYEYTFDHGRYQGVDFP